MFNKNVAYSSARLLISRPYNLPLSKTPIPRSLGLLLMYSSLLNWSLIISAIYILSSFVSKLLLDVADEPECRLTTESTDLGLFKLVVPVD